MSTDGRHLPARDMMRHEIFHPRLVPGDGDCGPGAGVVGGQAVVADAKANPAEATSVSPTGHSERILVACSRSSQIRPSHDAGIFNGG